MSLTPSNERELKKLIRKYDAHELGETNDDNLYGFIDELAALIAQETQKGFDAGIRSERLWWAKNRNSVSFRKTGVFESRIAALEREEIQ